VFSEAQLRNRVRNFQSLMKENRIEVAVIRTLSSFIYFTGIKWLRPALLIPAEGEPTAFIFQHEADEFASKCWVKSIERWMKTEDLMKGISGMIRKAGYKVAGFDYSVERDSYVLFFELFKTLNPRVEVHDVHELIMRLRMIKDAQEIECIRKASELVDTGMDAAVNSVDVGKSELEIAAEAVYRLMKLGAEHPLVYVNVGPRPRKHAEPRGDLKVGRGDCVSIVIGADYNNYFSNVSRTLFFGEASTEKRKAFEVVEKARHLAEEELKPSVELAEIEKRIHELMEKAGFGAYYSWGFTHGVGLLIEEDPITTIVVPHRRYKIAENMILAAVHVPLTVPNLGSVKCEDTFLIGKEGCEPLTKYSCETMR